MYTFYGSFAYHFTKIPVTPGMSFRILAIASAFFIVLFSSCAVRIIKNVPENKPYLIENSFDIKGGNFNVLEKEAVIKRLETQLDDSAVVKIKSPLFFLDIIKKPIAFDTGYAGISARSMEGSMYALGYYNAIATYNADTTDGKKVKVKYTLTAGKQTLIDTMSYRMVVPNLQDLATSDPGARILKKDLPITKAGVLGEINRLVDTFRNNGYYKFTAAELKLRGDTTIAALTQLSNDPFEQLELLAQAQAQRDSPTIKLQMVVVPPEDSSRLQTYSIKDIYVLEDYRPGDDFFDTTKIKQLITRRGKLILRFHEKYIRNGFLLKNIAMRPGDLYNQKDYYQTITNLSRAGIWQSVNVKTEEADSNRLNMILELIPGKKFGFETSLELSYSATSVSSNPLGANLFGVAVNVSLTNRNIGRQAIRMTHGIRAGIEFNSGTGRPKGAGIVNSDELTYTNSVVFPGKVRLLEIGALKNKPGESFIATRASVVNRFSLFNLYTFSINLGTTYELAKNKKLTLRPFNAELIYINKSDSFNKIVAANPFLRYSYTNSFILGMSASYSSIYNNLRHPLSLNKERTFRANIEESGFSPIGLIPIVNKHKSRYVKGDVEYKYKVQYRNTAFVFRAFAGIGLPRDTSLPFFKQFFGGGSNSMRGWPIRGIGRGSQPRAPFGTIFNDRTGDIQLETNLEYRYDIARIIPNTLTLRGAVFADIGNIWNVKSSTPGIKDPAQFKFKELYRELGMNVGTGFRLDFNYVVVRVDLGFRVKRPELADTNAGWKLPPLQFGDVFQKLFTRGANDENRRWRYENFNLTFGIGYPF